MQAKTAKPIPGQCKEATALHHRINEIIEAIPATYSERQNLVRALEDRQDSVLYTAPGAIAGRWHEVGQILENHIPEDADLSPVVIEIFGREIDD